MMKNVAILSFSLGLVVAAGAASLGCSGSAEQSQQPQTSASAVSTAPVGAQTHGMVKLVGDALGDVPLRPDQRAELEKIAADAEVRHAGLASGRRDLMLALADQIEAGAVDRAALAPKIDAISAAADQVRPQDQAALVRVHDLLDASQRGAFVDALEQRIKAKRGEHAHGSPWKQIAQDLDLSDDQRAQIKDVMKAARGEHGALDMMKTVHRGKAALESFRNDKFDGSEMIALHAQTRAAVAARSGGFVGVVEKVLPILTPEQRKIGADKLRALAASGDLPFAH